MRGCATRAEASVFIVGDPVNPGKRIMWNVALHGGHLLSPAFLTSPNGPMLRYKRALETKRYVWLSPLFLERQTRLAAILTTRLRDGLPTRWELVTERGSFLALVAKCSATGRNSTCYAFVDASEQGDQD